MPMEAEACSRGTPGQAEHRARKVSGHGEDTVDRGLRETVSKRKVPRFFQILG